MLRNHKYCTTATGLAPILKLAAHVLALFSCIIANVADSTAEKAGRRAGRVPQLKPAAGPFATSLPFRYQSSDA